MTRLLAREIRASHRSGFERDTTIIVKTYERRDLLLRLLETIRRKYKLVPIFVVDDSREALDPPPAEITRYWHLPEGSLGLGAGRNHGLCHAETEFVVFCDDDIVFGRRTDLSLLVETVKTTPFDLVSCAMMERRPGRSGLHWLNRYEGTFDLEDGVLVQRFGATRGYLGGLPVYDFVHQQLLVARRASLGDEAWNPSIGHGADHPEFFLRARERGLLTTMRADVVALHHPTMPLEYARARGNVALDRERWQATRGFRQVRVEGERFRRRDRVVYDGVGVTAARSARWIVQAGRRLRVRARP